jgi:glycosyltransferase involved in cell wall biosynthesis
MYHNIRILGRRHCVRVISFVENEAELDLLRTVGSICESVKGVHRVPDFRPHWLSLLPFMVREFSTPEMYGAIDRVFREWNVDVLQCEYLQMAQFRRPKVFNILTEHEAVSANASQEFHRAPSPAGKLKLYYRWMQLLRYEVMAVKAFDRIVTMTESDAAYLRSYAPSANIRAIPIGIDTREFIPLPEERGLPLEVLFVGNFRHTPNREAAVFLIEEIAPLFPGIRFVLPGPNVLAGLLVPENVEFPGYIPDTRVLYHRPNTIVAAPLFSGTGQRVKLLEAFAMGCPVITTSLGAEGFPVRHGIEALVANNVEEFCSALRALSSSETFRQELGVNARMMIAKSFDWEYIGDQFLKVAEEAAGE